MTEPNDAASVESPTRTSRKVRRWPWSKPQPPVHACEVCKATGVVRRGDWDYCPKGHTYIGARADA